MGLVLFAAAVHPYLAAMALVLTLAVLIRLWRARVLTIPWTAGCMMASTLGLLAVWGAIGYFGRTPDGSGGFGTYPADLLTLFDPTDYSRLIPRLGTFGGEWEGIGFLGAGGLIALGIALVALVRRRPTWRPGTGLIVGACVLLGVYALSSSIHFVGKITTPVLALSASDDPFLPGDVLPLVREAASPSIDFRTTRTGGHVGFIGGSLPWNCRYWAEALVVDWLRARV